jgi:hypothetical protein
MTFEPGDGQVIIFRPYVNPTGGIVPSNFVTPAYCDLKYAIDLQIHVKRTSREYHEKEQVH